MSIDKAMVTVTVVEEFSGQETSLETTRSDIIGVFIDTLSQDRVDLSTKPFLL